MSLPVRTHRLLAICISILLVSLSAATLAFTTTHAGPGCTHAQGRLFNAVAGVGPGRMIGTISGDYFIDPSSGATAPDDTGVLFLWGTSHIDGEGGTIYFREYAALDLNEQQGLNGGVLVIVTGGTGQWENASGHLALSGYFHTAESTGVWDYQGEVCVP